VFELHATVAVPEFVTVAGEMVPQVRPGGTVSVSVTVPVNALTAPTVMVEVADVPTVTEAEEFADTVKSVRVNVAVAEYVRNPLVPVIVRV